MDQGPAMDRPPVRWRAVRWLEAAAAVLAWLLQFWLTRQPSCIEGSCAGAAGGRWVSMALVLAVLWLAPGWMV